MIENYDWKAYSRTIGSMTRNRSFESDKLYFVLDGDRIVYVYPDRAAHRDWQGALFSEAKICFHKKRIVSIQQEKMNLILSEISSGEPVPEQQERMRRRFWGEADGSRDFFVGHSPLIKLLGREGIFSPEKQGIRLSIKFENRVENFELLLEGRVIRSLKRCYENVNSGIPTISLFFNNDSWEEFCHSRRPGFHFLKLIFRREVKFRGMTPPLFFHIIGQAFKGIFR